MEVVLYLPVIYRYKRTYLHALSALEHLRQAQRRQSVFPALGLFCLIDPAGWVKMNGDDFRHHKYMGEMKKK